MIGALVEDMIRLAPLLPAPKRKSDLADWAEDLAEVADAIYDAAESRVDIELTQEAAEPARPAGPPDRSN
jgi:hypothetical protein